MRTDADARDKRNPTQAQRANAIEWRTLELCGSPARPRLENRETWDTPRFGETWATRPNNSGLQWGTVRNLLMDWVLTLPMAMLLAGTLFWAFRYIF